MPSHGNDDRGGINLRHMYPLTIVPDRYNGTYSGGLYTYGSIMPKMFLRKSIQMI